MKTRGRASLYLISKESGRKLPQHKIRSKKRAAIKNVQRNHNHEFLKTPINQRPPFFLSQTPLTDLSPPFFLLSISFSFPLLQ